MSHLLRSQHIGACACASRLISHILFALLHNKYSEARSPCQRRGSLGTEAGSLSLAQACRRWQNYMEEMYHIPKKQLIKYCASQNSKKGTPSRLQLGERAAAWPTGEETASSMLHNQNAYSAKETPPNRCLAKF